MRTPPFTLLALCAIVAITALATAQPPPPPGPPGGPPPEVGESRELMEQVMITRLSRRLDLNDEQSLILMRRFAEVREQRQALNRERQEVLRELRNVIREERDEGALEHLMQQLRNLDNRVTEMNQEVRNAVTGLDLNIWQKAKLEIFLSEFEGEMRRVVQQARGDRPMMGPPDRPGPMMGDPDRPGPPRGPMMGDPDRPRPPREPGDGMRRQREERPEGPPGQRPPRMPDRPRRMESPPVPPAE